MQIAIRLTPRSRADRIDAISHLANGAAVLKVSVAAPPLDGRANDSLLRVLAEQWDLPRRDFAIVAGLKSRSKIVRISGDPANLLKRLGAALAALSRL